MWSNSWKCHFPGKSITLVQNYHSNGVPGITGSNHPIFAKKRKLDPRVSPWTAGVFCFNLFSSRDTLCSRVLNPNENYTRLSPFRSSNGTLFYNEIIASNCFPSFVSARTLWILQIFNYSTLPLSPFGWNYFIRVICLIFFQNVRYWKVPDTGGVWRGVMKWFPIGFSSVGSSRVDRKLHHDFFREVTFFLIFVETL